MQTGESSVTDFLKRSLMSLGIQGLGKGTKEGLEAQKGAGDRCQECLSNFRTLLKSRVIPDYGKQGIMLVQPLQTHEE